MSFAELIIELFFDAVAILMGILLIIRTSDNRQRLYWGVISVTIGFFFLWENLYWITTLMDNPTFEYDDILNSEKMLKWFASVTIISLFPLASLRPGYLNFKRVIVYFLPFIVVLVISLCYHSSEISTVELKSVEDIIPNIGKFDVRFRLVIFLLSILIPSIYYTYPIIHGKTYRKVSRNIYLFSFFVILLVGFYILFTLFINAFFFNGFGIISVVFAITFSFFFLRSENPLSIHTGEVDKVASKTYQVHPLYNDINSYLANNQPFVNSNYTLNELINALNETEKNVVEVIKSAGYTGFKEYINSMRLEHFKTLASQNSRMTVKELMFACGFTSRTTFYRLFAEQYGISPVKFIDSLKPV